MKIHDYLNDFVKFSLKNQKMQKPTEKQQAFLNYLKSSDLRQRQGILKGKRVDFFKGL
jgi:hypothetical protein